LVVLHEIHTIMSTTSVFPAVFDLSQAWLMLSHQRFVGKCQTWNDAECSGVLLLGDHLAVRVHCSDLLCIGRAALIPSERVEFGLITDSDGHHRAIYVTGPRGFFLHDSRVHGNKSVHTASKQTTRLQTKCLIQKLEGNLHPNGQLCDKARLTLKRWAEQQDGSRRGIKPSARAPAPPLDSTSNGDTSMEEDETSHDAEDELKCNSSSSSSSSSVDSKHDGITDTEHRPETPKEKQIQRLNCGEAEDMNKEEGVAKLQTRSLQSALTQKSISTSSSSSSTVSIPLKRKRNEWKEHVFVQEIERFYDASRPSKRRKKQKNLFFDIIYGYIEAFRLSQYPLESWHVFRFGSIIWNIDTSESDIDVAIDLNFRSMNIPKVIKQELLRRLTVFLALKQQKHRELQKYACTSILHARCPIITIEDRSFDIKMDISIADGSCCKTKDIIFEMIEKYSNQYEYPMRRFLVFIKHWSKQRGINDSPNRFINSFGYTLMAIKYVQYLSAVRKKAKSENLSYLVYNFFKYYVHFDAEKYQIDIMDAKHVTAFGRKRGKHPLEIIDPANPNNNVTKNVRAEQYRKICLEFKRAAKIYKAYMMESCSKSTTPSLFELLTKCCQSEWTVSVNDV